jgi:hypothetical protein
MQFLKYPSHGDRVASIALNLLSTFDSTNAVTIACQDAGPTKSTGLRFTALNILRRYGRGRSDAIAAVRMALDESMNSGIKNFAVQVLGAIGDDSVIPALEVVAKDGELQFREVAKTSIEQIKKRLGEKKQ